MAETHRLIASTSTVHWGYFESELKPALEVDSGDIVTIETVSGGADVLPGPGYYVPPELLEIHDNVPRKMLGHILTGPIRVNTAKINQVLQVDIIDIKLRQDWGYNFIQPQKDATILGTPKDAHHAESVPTFHRNYQSACQ